MSRLALRTAAPALRASLASAAAVVRAAALTAASVALVPAVLSAQIRGGFQQQALNLGDDLSETVDLGFNVNLSGNEGNLATVCANGYLIFGFVGVEGTCATAGSTAAIIDKGRGEGTVFQANSLGQLVGAYGNVLAPYFTDLDATQAGSGQVFVGNSTVNGLQAFAVTYNGVRGYNGVGANFFQVVFINRGLGSFDFEFNYGGLNTAPLRIGYGDDGGFSGVAEATVYADNGVIPRAGTRLSGSFVNGISPTDPLGRGTGISATVIPEPTTVALVGAGVLAFGAAARRRRTA